MTLTVQGWAVKMNGTLLLDTLRNSVRHVRPELLSDMGSRAGHVRHLRRLAAEHDALEAYLATLERLRR